MYENDWTRELAAGTDFPAVREIDLVTRGAWEDFVVLAGSDSSIAAQTWADWYNTEHPWTDPESKAVAGHLVPLVLPDGTGPEPLTGEVLYLVATGAYADTRPVAAELAQTWADHHYNTEHPWATVDDKATVAGTIELIPGTLT